MNVDALGMSANDCGMFFLIIKPCLSPTWPNDLITCTVIFQNLMKINIYMIAIPAQLVKQASQVPVSGFAAA